MLTGVVQEKTADTVVLNVHGVGYGLAVTAEDHGRLSSGETTQAWRGRGLSPGRSRNVSGHPSRLGGSP